MHDQPREPIAPQPPVESVAPLEAIAVPEPMEIPDLRPRPPGPGLPMAFVWSLAFLGIQFVVVLFIAMAITMGFVLTKGSAGLRAGQEALKEPVAMLSLGTVSVLVAVLVITGLALRGRFRRALAIRLPTLTHVVLVCLLAPPLYLLVLQVAVLAMQVMPEIGLLEELEETVKSAPYDIVLLAGAVIPGVSEEIFCRGFLGRGLVARWGVVPGILLTSLFFGLIHVEPVQICYAAFIGVVLHVVFLTSKSLLAPMLLHALNNAIAFSPTALGETFPQLSQVMNRWEENGALPPAVLIFTVLAVATLLVLFWQTQVRWFRSDGEVWDPGYVTAEIPPTPVQPKARSSSPKLWAVLVAAAAYLGFVVVMLHQFDLLPGW